ncbi:hypothetical protein FOHLNKBM_6094 [Methylobacterium longum]|nr:hypothetical protein FOHLNKBM_6094 [Methylobacterium longum]
MTEPAVELRRRKILRRLPQDLVGLPEFAVLALQRFDPLALVRRRAGPLALIPLGLANPVPQRLAQTADLTRDRADRCVWRAVLALMVKDQPDRALADLGRKGCVALRNGSSLSRVVASRKLGAIHYPTSLAEQPGEARAIHNGGSRAKSSAAPGTVARPRSTPSPTAVAARSPSCRPAGSPPTARPARCCCSAYSPAASCWPTRATTATPSADRSTRPGPRPISRPRVNRRCKPSFSPVHSRGRNAIERMFGRLKDFRRIVTSCDQLASTTSLPFVSRLLSASRYEPGRY